MEFKYKVGDLVTCEMKQGIYQIVGQVQFKKLSKNCDPGARYYFRKVFDKNHKSSNLQTKVAIIFYINVI